MRKALTAALAIVLAFGLMAGPALADYEFPSTNEQNRNQENPLRPGQEAPHVNLVEAAAGEVTLEFVMPHGYAACFEYRHDGDTTEAISDDHHNPWLEDDLYPALCLNDDTDVKTFQVEHYIEVRLAFGAERDWDFDWTRFNALPSELPDASGKDECKDGGWEEFGFRNQGQCVRFVNTGKDSR